MSVPLLEVCDLTASYGPSRVLHGVSFAVGAGEIVTLLGRNGMGRSTVVKCLFGWLPIGGGSVTFAGRRIDGLTSHRIARAGLALVPEGRQIFPDLSVEENLVATARLPDDGAGREAWTLARVYELFPRLRERRLHAGANLSGGEQQMLAIGRALMTNPRLLVLDEATEGLSPLVRGEIWRILGELGRGGLGMVVIDKNVSALLRLADRHYVMEKGRVVWSGDSAALEAEPEVIHRCLGV